MFRLMLRMTWRDWRAGELSYLLLAMVLAVGTLSTVNLFVDSFRGATQQEANQILAADLLVSSDSPLPAAWRSEALSRGLVTADTVDFSSVAMPGEGDDVASQLVTVRGVTSAYPLRGRLKLHYGTGSTPAVGGPASETAWVDPMVTRHLGLHRGDAIRLGDRTFLISGEIAAEPDHSLIVGAAAPSVMIAMADLPATHLLAPGARAYFHLLLAGDGAHLASFEHWLREQIKAKGLRGIDIDSLQSTANDLNNAVRQVQQFLSLTSLLATLLAAVAIAMASFRYLKRHIGTFAMLRCLGLTPRGAAALFAGEFALIGVIACSAGTLCGLAGYAVLRHYLSGILAFELHTELWLPAAQSLCAGMLLLAGFTLPALLQLRTVAPGHLLRNDMGAIHLSTKAAYCLGAGAYLALLFWQTHDIALALFAPVGISLSLSLFVGVTWLVLRGVQLIRPVWVRSGWQMPLDNLLRRRWLTLSQVASVGVSLAVLLLLTIVRHDLLQGWLDAEPADAPTHYLLNIQPDQVTDIQKRAAALGPVTLQTILRGRLIAVNGRSFSGAQFEQENDKAVADQEFSVVPVPTPPSPDVVTAGRWPTGAVQTTQFSVDERTASALKLRLGDALRFDIGGQRLDGTVTSLRKRGSPSRHMSFAFLVNAAAVHDMPGQGIAQLQVPPTERSRRLLDQLQRDYPNLSIVDVSAMLGQLQNLLESLSRAVTFLFCLALAAGVLVLYGLYAASRDERAHQTALMRTLGATRRQLLVAQWREQLLMGMLAGGLAAAAATAVDAALAHWQLHLPWHVSPLLWLVGVSVGTACALVSGWAGLRHIVNQPPLCSLRRA